ncbi:MAG: hypothetical protein FD163_1606 [Hyphomonadaceae bacterium]|nr:MAG: hypothetical protein FD163_1606 [Hyphomonadaceae bacterium]
MAEIAGDLSCQIVEAIDNFPSILYTQYQHRRIMTAVAKTQDLTLNIRTKTYVRDLIDSAAAILGKNRSEFMLEVAVREAQDVLLDKAFFALSDTKFAQITFLLDNPPPPNAKLLALLAKKAPWEK